MAGAFGLKATALERAANSSFTVLKADADFQQEASETDTGEPLLEVPNSVATL